MEDTETSQIPLNIITHQEFREIEANLHHRCRDKFEQARDNYDQTAINIEDAVMNIREKLYTQDDSPQLANLVERTKNHLINLRKRQVKIEKNIHKLAKMGENNNPSIIMPVFGTNRRDSCQWKNIPNFNPKLEHTTSFETIWTLIATRGQRENLSEEAYKETLEEILKGDALKFYTINSNKPLSRIIEILFNAFVTTRSKQQIREQLNSFEAVKGHSFRQTLERLKLLTSEYYKDLPPHRAAQEEDTKLRRRIAENHLVSKSANRRRQKAKGMV